MAGADISVIYEVRRHLSTCTVSCSRTFGTYNTTGNRAQAGRLLRCHRQRHQTTCEPTEPGLMNGVLPFLFRLWKIIVAALRAPPGDLLSRCRPTTVPRSPSSSLSLSPLLSVRLPMPPILLASPLLLGYIVVRVSYESCIPLILIVVPRALVVVAPRREASWNHRAS